MIPSKTIEELILKHSTLEKDLSSGNLDKNALFYLRSRGINEEDARGILVEGFINKLLSSFSLKFLSLDQRIKEWI